MKSLFLTITLFLSIAYPHQAKSFSFSLGLTGGLYDNKDSTLAGGLNARILWGSGKNQFGLGGKGYFYSQNKILKGNKLLALLYRYDFMMIGPFYGIHIQDVNSYLDEGLFSFSNLLYQQGIKLEFLYFISPRLELGIETRYHHWLSSGTGPDYLSTWLNLNYWWP